MPKKRAAKSSPRGCMQNLGIVFVGIIVLAVIGSMTKNSSTSRNTQRATAVVSTATSVQVNNETRDTAAPSATATDDAGRSVQDESTKAPDTATDVPPAATSIPVQEEAAVDVIDISARIFYTQGSVNVRSCASTTCEVVTRLERATAVSANGQATGEAVNAGNTVWYRVDIDGTEGYIYSGLLSNTPNSTSNTTTGGGAAQPPAATSAPQFVCPSNCTEAVNRGVSAQQAAACGLDRDGDGVACYGD